MRTLDILWRVVLSACIVCLPGCGFIEKIQRGVEHGQEIITSANELYKEHEETIKKTVDNVRGIADEVNSTAAEMRQLHRDSRAAADTNGDGELSLTEWPAYLSMMAAGGVEVARRKTRKDLNKAFDKIDDLKAAQKDSERAELERLRAEVARQA